MMICYLAILNILGFLSMASDKRKARLGKRRTPERVLFLIATAGGSIGSILGMFAFRHKTRHLSFRLGLPAILALQCAAAYLLWRMMQGH